MSLIYDLAYKAGIVKNEDFASRMEKIGGRGYVANEAELTEFAKLVGQMAREDERRKLNVSGSTDGHRAK
mgnify:CR=1 FL=1|tara:strand:- start:713 stop:922 length:210 start_codon:yes stop_codon:yes gene_type:complete